MLAARPRPADLPEYERPPVDEVAIAIQFHPLPGYSEAVAGEYRDLVADDYPMFDTQPRIEPVIESLTSQTPGPPQIQAIVGPPGTRFDRAWLINDLSEIH
jgi:uncharacterized protein (TIGR04255 family)